MTSFGLWSSPVRQAQYGYHRGSVQSRGISQVGYPNYLIRWNLVVL